MPTDSKIIGFTNCWYAEGFQNAINYRIDKNMNIKIFSAPYFIASKIEAFKARGGEDFRTSHDFEDLVYVLENSKDLVEKLVNSPDNLQKYLKKEFKVFLQTPTIEEGIYGHTDPKFAHINTKKILEMLRNFLKII